MTAGIMYTNKIGRAELLTKQNKKTPILLCYVLFCNGVWPLFNKKLLTYLLTTLLSIQPLHELSIQRKIKS